MDWDDRVSNRLKVSDLRLLFAVVQAGGMAKAAAQLNLSQPAISKAIATLEKTVGVRLLDRNSRGIEPTCYGRALLRRGVAIFDELRQGVNEIRSLSDPSAGELRIASCKSISAGILGPVIKRMSERYPRVRLSVQPLLLSAKPLFPQLDNREVDLVFTRLSPHNERDDVEVEILFDDQICLAVGKRGPWGSRRKVELTDLINARWISVPFDDVGGVAIAKAFRARGLEPPKIAVTTYSIHLRSSLATNARFVAALPASVLRLNAHGLRELSIGLPISPWPIAIITPKHRTLNPVVELFRECARDITKLLAPRSNRSMPYWSADDKF